MERPRKMPSAYLTVNGKHYPLTFENIEGGSPPRPLWELTLRTDDDVVPKPDTINVVHITTDDPVLVRSMGSVDRPTNPLFQPSVDPENLPVKVLSEIVQEYIQAARDTEDNFTDDDHDRIIDLMVFIRHAYPDMKWIQNDQNEKGTEYGN